MILIVVPWYLLQEIAIWQGNEVSEIGGILGATQSAHQNVTFFQYLLTSLFSLDKYFYLLIFCLLASLFLEPVYQFIFYVGVFPYIILWSAVASYDFRNLAPALPLFAIIAGLNIENVYKWVITLLEKIKITKIKLVHFIMFLLILLGSTFFFIPDSVIIQKNQSGQMNAFSASLNEKLLNAMKNEPQNELILTNYPMDTIAGLGERKVPSIFAEYSAFIETMQNPQIIFLLMPANPQQEILKTVQDNLQNGNLQLIFEDSSWINYIFIRVLKNPWIVIHAKK